MKLDNILHGIAAGAVVGLSLMAVINFTRFEVRRRRYWREAERLRNEMNARCANLRVCPPDEEEILIRKAQWRESAAALEAKLSRHKTEVRNPWSF